VKKHGCDDSRFRIVKKHPDLVSDEPACKKQPRLSVVRKAAKAHHGHVWVISDDKSGTTFSLSLPMDERRAL